VSGRLAYQLPADVVAASLNRAVPGPDGPVLHRLVDPANRTPKGAIVLPPYQRPWFIDGELRFVIQTPEKRVTLTPWVSGLTTDRSR
jgi:hypothetical protein